MELALMPHTAAGQRFVVLAEQHAADFATRAEQHDREGSFPFENITALQHSGVLAACVPEAFGGFGIESLYETVLGINRLARGDGSTAIAANMHIFYPWRLTRTWRAATQAAQTLHAQQAADLLRQVGAGQLVRCALLSESGTELVRPLVEATKTEDGWILNGTKSFATMSPAATLMEVTCCVKDTQGGWRRAMASVPRGTPGMHITHNWDALGMRGSGSHDVEFIDCFVPESALLDGGPWGVWTEGFLASNMAFAMGLSGAFLGLAEAARDFAVSLVKTRRHGPGGPLLAERYAMQHAIAEIEVDLAAARAMLARSTTLADALFQTYPAGSVPMTKLHQVMKDFQCTKLVVTRKAIDIVDHALTVSGGAGYLSKHPLSRLYRDVRAGPFMQPFSPNEAFAYIGRVTLGLDPDT
jgi:alkylation response protein AidB-like acyl-CoA dehydrogenase